MAGWAVLAGVCSGLISPATEWVKEGSSKQGNASKVPEGGGLPTGHCRIAEWVARGIIEWGR